MQDERDVDGGVDEAGRESADEGDDEVGCWVEHDHANEAAPDADTLDEEGEDDGLDEERDEPIYSEESADIVQVQAETTLEIEARGVAVVQKVYREECDVCHLVVCKYS